MKPEKILLGITGDVMIGRGVDKAITQYGYRYPWGDVLALLRSTDFNLINLETTLTNSNHAARKTFNFRAAPDKVNSLIEAKITLTSIANNHILDYSVEGLMDTLHTLAGAGIKYAGCGTNSEEASKGVHVNVKDVNFGLLSFTDNEPGWKAGRNKCGINYIKIGNPKDRQKAATAVKRMREQSDIVLVSIHWGPNLREEPSPEFVDFAHQLIQSGADLIHGHSAHIFQAIEIYDHKLIIYDSGDFIDDYVVYPQLRNDLSFLYVVEYYGKSLKCMRLVPVIIRNYQVNKATGKEYDWCMQRIRTLSEKFSTNINEEGEILINLEELNTINTLK